MPLNSKKKAATAKASTKVASRSAHARPRPESPDAIELLKTDHREVEEFFAQFEKASSRQRKAAIVANICQALSVHAAIEEEIFYPAVRKALSRATRKLVDEAEVEHEGIKTLVAYLKKAKPTVRHYDAKVVVLKEYVSHHVKEEEHVLFPVVAHIFLKYHHYDAKVVVLKEYVSHHGKKNV